MIRVLVTDDSAFMRKLLSDIINSDPELEVVGTAKDGKDMLDKLIKAKPDVITLDISMPVMDGLAALKKIMEENPMPVVMISALSDEENTFASLELGAVDFIPKTSGIISLDMNKKRDTIIGKIKAAVNAKVQRKVTEQVIEGTEAKLKDDHVICMGASTGGPKAIESVLQALPANFNVPLVIVQHIPSEFSSSFVKRLSRNSSLEIVEAQDGKAFRKGVVYIVPGDSNLDIVSGKIKLKKSENAIDDTMKSLVKLYGSKTLGVILTGMGKDGVAGMKAIHKDGGKTIVQDESTCVVPTLPVSVVKAQAADKVVPLSSIAKEMINVLKK